MGRFESLRDRLPSLYRPDADEAVEPLHPLTADDLLEVLTAEGPATFFARARPEGTLLVDFDEPVRVVALRLAPGCAPGSGYAVELYPFAEPTVLATKPAVVAGATDGFAPLRHPFEQRRFGLMLKRRSLLTAWLQNVANVLEQANTDAAGVMQAHWFRFADRALYSPFLLRGRALHDPPLAPPEPDDPEVLDFPYVLDLGRVGSLLSLPPWQQSGAGSVESVEAYRQRIARVVALYTVGLGTVDALRRMTEAQLPVDLDAPPPERDLPFEVEELAPLETVAQTVTMPGAPTDLVGPLMHWTLSNDGLTPAPPTVKMRAADADELSAVGGTEAAAPVIELFDPSAEQPALGLAYRDTIPAGQTLRLRPAYASWLGTDAGVAVARSEPGDDPADPADPAAPGPWATADGAPPGQVAVLRQTADRVLWAAVNDGTKYALWTLSAGGWTKVLDRVGSVFALAEAGIDVVAGTTNGLLRVTRFPDSGHVPTGKLEPQPGSRSVQALLRTADGTLWQGTSKGLGTLGDGDAFEPFVLTGDLATRIAALASDSTGALYAGGDLGLFQYQPASGRWYWYSGEGAADQISEWKEFDPTGSDLPADASVFLPPVTCVHRARDGALWIGTEAGLARYVARAERGTLAYRTVLEAFPDLVPGGIDAIAEDERGLMWFATDRGLLRFDGRDFLQYRADGAWAELGRADSLYDGPEPRPRGTWRYRRAGAEWQRFGEELATPDWVPFATEPRTTAEPAVRALLFTDAVAADLLDDGGASTAVDAGRLVMRFKLPGYERIVDGGLPAVPRLGPGQSSWRYLSLEPDDAPPSPGPAWTIEGRFVAGELPPPADPEPDPGRFDETDGDADAGAFDAAVFAFPPAVRVALEWTPRRPLRVLARLGAVPGGDAVEPAVLDRVWQGLQQVRPAGVRVALAVGGTIVRQP